MDFAAFFREQLHFFLNHGEDQHLLILVEHAITTHIKDLDELLRCVQAQKVVDVFALLLIDESNISVVQETFSPEVRLSNRRPDLLALAGATDERPGLSNQLVDLVAWDVRQA